MGVTNIFRIFLLLFLVLTIFSATAEAEDLLIIYPDEFYGELKPLKDFKDASGRSTILLSLSDIYNNPSCSGGDEPEKIKKCIAHYEKNKGVKYVLLVGDCDKFPVRYIKAYNTEWGTKYYPSDLYYADLYNSAGYFDDWDYDNDGNYGETDFNGYGEKDVNKLNLDKINMYPDVAVARIPASNDLEVTTYVNKVINYEINAPDNWFNKALWVVDYDWAFPKNKDRLDSYLPGFTIDKVYEDYSWDKMDRDQRAAALNQYFNQGYGFINYYGHGSRFAWSYVYDQQDPWYDMNNLTNQNKLPAVYAVACYTGRFHFDRDYYLDANNNEWNGGSKNRPEPMPVQSSKYDKESLAEEFLVKRDTGAITYIGSVSVHERGGEDLDKYFFEAYYGGKSTFGDMWNYALSEWLNNLDLWSYYAFIHMHKVIPYGDPSLKVGGSGLKKMTITHDTTLHPMIYNLPGGIEIRASDVTLDCNGSTIKGSGYGNGIYIPKGFDNVTVKNCYIKNYANGTLTESNDNTIINNQFYQNSAGVNIQKAWNYKVIDNKLESNGAGIKVEGDGIVYFGAVNEILDNDLEDNNYGIYLVGASTAKMAKNRLFDNNYGVYLYNSKFNSINNNRMDLNDYGIYAASSNYNEMKQNIINYIVGTIIDGSFEWAGDYGIFLLNSDNNKIVENTVSHNNESGIYFNTYSNDNNLTANKVCDNYQDITNNVNYGTNNGDDNTCYSVHEWNDEGTLGCTYLCTEEPVVYYCDSCADCQSKINNAPPGSIIKLTKNILNHHGTCIEWMGDGKTFDCQNHLVDGDDSTGDPIEGIYHTGIELSFGPEGNTIENCLISDFEIGISMEGYFGNHSYYNRIINNTIYSNVAEGIEIDSASDVNIFTTIENNVITNNGDFGLVITSTHKNLIDSNIVCSNGQSDFFLTNSYNNSGANNYCDSPDGWNDIGTTGCTNPCAEASIVCEPGEVIPYDDMEITTDTKLCRGFYNIPDPGYDGVIKIKSNGVTLDCNGAIINGGGSGGGILNNGFDNVTLKNCNIKNYRFGIGVIGSYNNIITSNNISKTHLGIGLEDSTLNTLSFNNIHDNYGFWTGSWPDMTYYPSNGISLSYSSSNVLSSNHIHSNDNGVTIKYSPENSLASNNINDNLRGINISTSDFSSCINNQIEDNKYGIYLIDSNNTEAIANIICGSTISDLYLDGSFGNYGKSNYCDSPDGWNDIETTGCTNPCAEAPVCGPGEVIPHDDMEITSDTKLCRGVYNISDLGGWGVIYVKSGNLVLDCNDAVLNGEGGGRGIYAGDVQEVTIENCHIQNYGIGIDTHSDYSTIVNNNLNNNTNGIVLWQANHNTIARNYVLSSTNHGIDLHGNSDLNNIYDNVIQKSGEGVWFAADSNENELNSNTICFNDLDVKDDDQNIGDENTCSIVGGWNDTGTTGCTNSCDDAPVCEPGEVIPYDDMEITTDTKLCCGFYDIPDSGGWGVLNVKSDNVVLDCNDAVLNGEGGGRGIYAGDVQEVTIENCHIQNYGIGIDTHSDYSAITNNTLDNNTNGIVLWQANHNTIARNYVKSNSNHGIDLHGDSDLNIITDNVIQNNGEGVWFAADSNVNELNSNTICSNTIDVKDDDQNFGDENTCSILDGWNDTGTTGCTYSCKAGCGDVNCDDTVDISDVIRLLYYVGYPGQYSLCGEWAGDVTGDGSIDISDVIRLLYYVGYPGQYGLSCS